MLSVVVHYKWSFLPDVNMYFWFRPRKANIRRLLVHMKAGSCTLSVSLSRCALSHVCRPMREDKKMTTKCANKSVFAAFKCITVVMLMAFWHSIDGPRAKWSGAIRYCDVWLQLHIMPTVQCVTWFVKSKHISLNFGLPWESPTATNTCHI